MARVLSFREQKAKVEVNYITIIIRILLKNLKTILELVLNVYIRLKNITDNKILDLKFHKIPMNLCLLRFETHLNNYKKFYTGTLSLEIHLFFKFQTLY